MGLMGLIGVLSSGLLADAFGAVRPTVICFFIRMFIFAFIIFDQSTSSIFIFGLLYGLTFLITAPLTVVFVGNIFGVARLGTLAGQVGVVVAQLESIWSKRVGSYRGFATGRNDVIGFSSLQEYPARYCLLGGPVHA